MVLYKKNKKQQFAETTPSGYRAWRLSLIFFSWLAILIPALPAIAQQDTTQVASDSVNVGKGPIETTIEYSANDTIDFDVITNTVYLVGDAKVKYGNLTIEAARIKFDLNTKIVRAYGIPDSTGRLEGIPVFKEGSQTYNADSMIYNIGTRKGIISNIVTQQGDGYIISNKVKKSPDESFFAASNIYTTCNLEEPHFGIRASKLKVVPGKYVIAGPFNFELNKVPTPLGFAFGLFPFSDKRSAGIIVPTYGETRERGFYLRDGGFYFPLGDYAGVKLLGQIYSLGGWGAAVETNYRVRYRYQGNFSFSYNKNVRQTDGGQENIQKDFWVRWSHSPQSKGSGRFSANINAGTTTFNRNNALDVGNFISASFQSSVSYSKTFEGTPFSAGANLRLNQNVNTGITTLFPEANLAMRRIYPFKSKTTTKSNPINEINFAYNFRARADITNSAQSTGGGFPFTIFNPTASETPTTPTTNTRPPEFFANFGTYLNRAVYGASHDIPLSTSFTLLKFFTFAPSFNFREYWYAQSYDYEYVQGTNRVRVDTLKGFARANEWNMGIGTNTRLYAFFYPKLPRVEAIRYVFNPSVSFSYRPDFGQERYGIYRRVQTNENGSTQLVSRYQGGLYGVPGFGKSSSIGITLANQIEAKVRTKPDSTGKVESKKVPILQNFGISTGYNVAADSFNLSNINFNTRFDILKNVPFINGVSINLNGTIDPYTYVLESARPTGNAEAPFNVTQRRISKFAWQTGNGIGNLTNASLNFSTSLKPPQKKDKKKTTPTPRSSAEEAELENVRLNPEEYVDFSIPWSLNVSYFLTYSKSGFRDANLVQNLTFSGELKLTEKWKIGGRSSYDFSRKAFGITSLNLYRDLHCWQMNLSWVPFGVNQFYSIDIAVKSSILQDLKLSKRNTRIDRGFIAQ